MAVEMPIADIGDLVILVILAEWILPPH